MISFKKNLEIPVVGKKINVIQLLSKIGLITKVTAIKTSIAVVKKLSATLLQQNFIVTVNHSFNNEKSINILSFFKKDFYKVNITRNYLVNNQINYYLNQSFGFENFKISQNLKISGSSSGKGYSGNIKRHNFHRGPTTHGSKHKRLQGSIGSGTTPGRVIPGKKMSGRLGNQTINVEASILSLNPRTNLLFLNGSIPGKNGTYLNLK